MIFLHIGKAKTGTTSIQHFLYKNSDKLLQAGFLYPASGTIAGGHHNIFYDLSQSEKYKSNSGGHTELIQEIKEYKNQHPEGNVLVSSETFEAMPNRHLKSLTSSLKELDEVTGLFVLRRQDDFLASYWAMQCSRMYTAKSIDDWCKDKAELDKTQYDGNKYRLDYHIRIGQLEEIFGKHNLRLYSYEKWKETSLIKNFLSAVGLSKLYYAEPTILNQGAGLAELELLRLFTSRIGAQVDPDIKKKIKATINKVIKRKDWAKLNDIKPQLDSVSRAYISQIYAESNNSLVNIYPELSSSLFLSKTYDSHSKGPFRLPAETLADLSLEFMKEHS